MLQTISATEARATLIALISATAGSPTGATLCRRLLSVAANLVAGEPEEIRTPPSMARAAEPAIAPQRAAEMLADLAMRLTMASEHAEFLAEHVGSWSSAPR
jgi:hypothetical protein